MNPFLAQLMIDRATLGTLIMFGGFVGAWVGTKARHRWPGEDD